MPEITDYDVTQAMLTYGGSFIEKLARAFRAADARNQARIKDAFADYWQEYTLVVFSADKDAEMRSLRGLSDAEKARI